MIIAEDERVELLRWESLESGQQKFRVVGGNTRVMTASIMREPTLLCALWKGRKGWERWLQMAC